MKKLIVFDWNGTLLSDTNACMDADNHVLKAFGGKVVNLKTYRNTIIIPAIDFYVQHGCSRNEIQQKSQKLNEIFHSFYEQRAAKCRTRQGAKELLQWLSRHSIKSIILSNHTVIGINNQLERLGLKKFVSEIVANSSLDNSLKKRNKKEKLAQYLKTHKYNPKDVFIIGDSPEETESGKELGVGTVAITNGYYSESRLRAAKPDHLIHSLNEFKKIIKKS